jgi:hypothetical protein
VHTNSNSNSNSDANTDTFAYAYAESLAVTEPHANADRRGFERRLDRRACQSAL